MLFKNNYNAWVDMCRVLNERFKPPQDPNLIPLQKLMIYKDGGQIKDGEFIHLLPNEIIKLTVGTEPANATYNGPYWKCKFGDEFIKLYNITNNPLSFAKARNTVFIKAVNTGSAHISIKTDYHSFSFNIIIATHIPFNENYIEYHTSDPFLQRKPFMRPVFIYNIKEAKEGNKFKGWSTQKDGNTVDYKYDDPYMLDKKLNLYPVWKPDEYVLTYESKIIGEESKKQKLLHGVKAYIISDTYEREGYIFGWGKTRYKTKVDYAPGEAFIPFESFSIFPIWERKKFTLTYDANGGENAPNEQTIEADLMTYLSDVIPKRKGYVFLGWSENKSSWSAVFQPKGQFADRRDVKLYAMWEEFIPSMVTKVDFKNGKMRINGNLRSSPDSSNNDNLIELLKINTPVIIKGFCKDNINQEWYWLGASEFIIKDAVMVDSSSNGSSGKINPFGVELPLSKYPNNAYFNTTIDGSTECDAFARLVFNEVYGYYPTRLREVPDEEKVKDLLTESNLYEYLLKMGEHSYFRGHTKENEDYPVGSPHSAFIVSFTDKTVTYYDANAIANTILYKENVSYSQFLSLFKYYIWHYSN